MTGHRAKDQRDSATDDRNPIRNSDEITAPPTDPVRVANERDVYDPADVDIDPEVWRQGGPTRVPGVAPTTGSVDGPPLKSRTAGRKNEGRTAPTTTGDATSGGMGTPAGGTTSDATTSGTPAGHLDELDERR